MKEMTPEEAKAFLMEGSRTGKLASVRADGRPHVAPIWFVLDGDELIFSTWHASVKAQNIRRDPRVALCVDDQEPPFAYVIVEGTASLIENPDDMLAWTTRLAGRYMGAELAESYGKRNAVEGEYLVRVRPDKIIAQKEIAE